MGAKRTNLRSLGSEDKTKAAQELPGGFWTGASVFNSELHSDVILDLALVGCRTTILLCTTEFLWTLPFTVWAQVYVLELYLYS